MIWNPALDVCWGELESFTWNVRWALVTGADGVPLIKPVDAFSAKPAGNDPAVKAHVNGVTPPVTVNVWEYATPTWPFARDVVEMARLDVSMVRINTWVADCAGELESVTRNVIEAGSVNCGVPLIRPVEGSNARPPGNRPVAIDQA